MTIALYPGSFDPITNGHLDIITRASRIFDEVIVGIYDTPAGKTLLFPTEERETLAIEATAHLPNVKIMAYTGLTGEFARSIKANTMVRGLRMGGDFEREFTLAMMSKKLYPELEQVSLMASVEYQFVSSGLLKEAASLGANIDEMVPPNVAVALRKRFQVNIT